MVQGHLNIRKVGRFLSRVGLITLLSLLLANTRVLADSPGEQALRARVDQLYSALRQGDWKKVEKYLTKDSRRIFHSEPKKTLTEYQVDSVKIEANGQSAQVVVRLPGPPTMIAGPPAFLAPTTRWQLVCG